MICVYLNTNLEPGNRKALYKSSTFQRYIVLVCLLFFLIILDVECYLLNGDGCTMYFFGVATVVLIP